MISFVVNMKPTPKDRPRFFRRGRFIGTYSTQRNKDAEKTIQAEARKHFEKPMTCAISIRIIHMIKTSDKKKIAMPKMTRPDLDNLDKLVMDALNGIAYVDDGQVVAKNSYKFWCDVDRIDISVREFKS